MNQFLTECVRGIVSEGGFPEWPATSNDTQYPSEDLTDLVAFHGIALFLACEPSRIASWPPSVRDWLREQARLQSFWELGHRQVLTRLLETLGSAGAATTITKGTALAYLLYDDPAMRRRGDSDLIITGASQNCVRAALRRAGFKPVGDRRPLQESWACYCRSGFMHVFDLHWRVSASAAISRCLERGGIGSRSIALDRLCPGARSISPTDNLILIAMNRALHGTFGYLSGEKKSFDQNRLVWAIDVDLLCRSFSAEDWSALFSAAEQS